MSHRDVVHKLVEGMDTPPPPPELRDRALAAVAMPWGESRSDVWTRLRSSTAVQLAWAASVIALLIGHLVLSLPSRRLPQPRQPVLVVAGAAAGSELAGLVDLPLVAGEYTPSLDATTIGSEIERSTNHGI